MTYTERAGRVAETYEACNRRDLDAVFTEVVADYRVVDHATGTLLTTRDEARAALDEMLLASSDQRCEILDVIEGRAHVVVRVRCVGTHDGPLGPLRATGATLDMEMCEVHRLDNEGRIAETHRYYDRMAMLTQLGVATELAEIAVG